MGRRPLHLIADHVGPELRDLAMEEHWVTAGKVATAVGAVAGLLFRTTVWLRKRRHDSADVTPAGKDRETSRVVGPPGPSSYSACAEREGERLEIQGDLDFMIDKKAIDSAVAGLPDHEPDSVTALDVGCASGYVTRSRFLKRESFRRVVGIDRDIDLINIARCDTKFDFRVADITEDRIATRLKNFSEHTTADGYDLVFSALMLHHLSDPVHAVRAMRKTLKDNGALVIRASDDGSKLCHPDEHAVLSEVLACTAESPGSSDRDNGRKLFQWLLNAGFNKKDITFTSEVVDTVGMESDDRVKLFDKSFGYRADYLKKACMGGSKEHSKSLESMEKNLGFLRGRFGTCQRI